MPNSCSPLYLCQSPLTLLTSTTTDTPSTDVPPKQQFNVYLNPETVARIKHRAIDVQRSLSDLVEEVLISYLDGAGDGPTDAPGQQPEITLQPMIHVTSMGRALDFYTALGATVAHGSRDGETSHAQ